MRLLDTLEESDVLVEGNTTIYDLCAQLGKLLLESIELLLDLVGKLSVVAEHKSWARLRVLGKLMKDSKDKDCSLSHTWLGLAEDVNTNHGLRDALLLDFWGVLETTINNGSLELWSEKHVLETCWVDWGAWVLDPKLSRVGLASDHLLSLKKLRCM